MGYSTDFFGNFQLSEQLTDSQVQILRQFSEQRHDGLIGMSQVWCDWVPTQDGKGICWNGSEKTYDSVSWLNYVSETFLKKWGIIASGVVRYQGEDDHDCGVIVAKDGYFSMLGVDRKLDIKQLRVIA
jgi:hypothetical protein